MTEPSRKDHFPQTPRSWIDEQLANGTRGVAATNHHIMSVYSEPLQAYYNGSSFRTMGDAHDLVASFFANRLSRQDFLHSWQSSGRKLRHWLIVSFRYFLKELRAARSLPVESSDAANHNGSDNPDQIPGCADIDPERLFHREVARSMVRTAVAITEEQCAQDDLAVHWQVWVCHVIHGRSYPDLAMEFELDPVRLKVMTRTVSQRFRQTLREQAAWPGALQSEVDDELRELITDLSPGA